MRLVAFFADLLLKWQRSSSQSLQDDLDAYERGVSVLSAESAMKLASHLLSDPKRFRCVESLPSAEDASRLRPLGPTLKTFFGTYQTVETIYGDVRLSRMDLAPSELRAEFIKVGSNTDAVDVVTKPNADTIYEIDGSEPPSAPLKGFPSIWHWLLVIGKVIYPEWEGHREIGGGRVGAQASK